MGPDGVVAWANRAELSLLGYEAHEYVGRNIAEFHADPNVAADLIARLARGEALHNFEATLRSRDGAHKHVIISSSVQWRDGKFAYARSFTQDVTARKRSEEANRRARQELEQAVRFSETFTAILGHDLRNPLGGILATAEMAARRPESERMVKSLTRIIASGQRMARMIDQLLDLTRVRLGTGIPLRPKRVDVLPLARQALDELAVAHRDWTFRLDHAGDTTGVWDDDRLYQVLSNLAGNAVQHGEAARGVDVHIDGTTEETIRIRIHNAGAVPAELLPRLFEPMAGGERRREKSQGLGLGLFITQQVAKAHGGLVEVASAPSTGTTFTVSLPRFAPGGEKGN
jgi:PAS domain S-box-containing protein